jgi:ribosome-binding protein aMBF1 (putative translation factor)
MDLKHISNSTERLVTGELLEEKSSAKRVGAATRAGNSDGVAQRVAFAAKVRAGRALLGWSQTQLGQRLGMSQRAVYKIEHSAVAARKSTEGAINQLFESIGLEFEPLADGGFVIRVGGKVLADADDRAIRDRR